MPNLCCVHRFQVIIIRIELSGRIASCPQRTGDCLVWEHVMHLRSFVSRGKTVFLYGCSGWLQKPEWLCLEFHLHGEDSREKQSFALCILIPRPEHLMATIRSREISIRLSELSMSDYETTTSFCILRYYVPYLGNIITVVLIVTAKKLMCHSCWTHSCFFIPSITWLLLIAHYKKPCYWHVCKPICSPLKTNVQEMSQWGKIMFIQSLGPWDIGSGSIILYQKTIMGESRVQKKKKTQGFYRKGVIVEQGEWRLCVCWGSSSSRGMHLYSPLFG